MNNKLSHHSIKIVSLSIQRSRGKCPASYVPLHIYALCSLKKLKLTSKLKVASLSQLPKVNSGAVILASCGTFTLHLIRDNAITPHCGYCLSFQTACNSMESSDLFLLHCKFNVFLVFFITLKEF